jgi:hypothetical protein
VYSFYNGIQNLTSETTKLVFKFSEPETIAQEIRTALEDTGFSNENKQLLNQLISNNLENSVNEIYKRLDQRFEAELSTFDMTKKEKSALNSRVKAYCEQFTRILSGHSTLENTFQQQLLNGEDPTQIINDSSLERGQKDLMLSILTQAEAYLTRTTQDQSESFRLLGNLRYLPNTTRRCIHKCSTGWKSSKDLNLWSQLYTGIWLPLRFN